MPNEFGDPGVLIHDVLGQPFAEEVAELGSGQLSFEQRRLEVHKIVDQSVVEGDMDFQAGIPDLRHDILFVLKVI